jgi:hypothetical protein
MIDPKKAVIVICCETMQKNLTDAGTCRPRITNEWPPYLVACDDYNDDAPLVYCPWCRKKIEKKP